MVGIFLVLGVVPLSIWAALVLFILPARVGALRATAVGPVIYLGIGLVTAFVTGIPGYFPPGASGEWVPWLVLAWPTYWLWLHECALGFGLWSCPPG